MSSPSAVCIVQSSIGFGVVVGAGRGSGAALASRWLAQIPPATVAAMTATTARRGRAPHLPPRDERDTLDMDRILPEAPPDDDAPDLYGKFGDARKYLFGSKSDELKVRALRDLESAGDQRVEDRAAGRPVPQAGGGVEVAAWAGVDEVRAPGGRESPRAFERHERIGLARHDGGGERQRQERQRRKNVRLRGGANRRIDVGRRDQEGRPHPGGKWPRRGVRDQRATQAVRHQDHRLAGGLDRGGQRRQPRLAIRVVPVELNDATVSRVERLPAGLPVVGTRAAETRQDQDQGRFRRAHLEQRVASLALMADARAALEGRHAGDEALHRWWLRFGRRNTGATAFTHTGRIKLAVRVALALPARGSDQRGQQKRRRTRRSHGVRPSGCRRREKNPRSSAAPSAARTPGTTSTRWLRRGSSTRL